MLRILRGVGVGGLEECKIMTGWIREKSDCVTVRFAAPIDLIFCCVLKRASERENCLLDVFSSCY